MADFSGFEHCVRENEPLAPFTWFRLGGAAEHFAEPTSVDELAGLVKRCRDQETPVRMLGGGSNLLVRDRGVAGLVIHLSGAPFAAVTTDGDKVTAGGGAKLSQAISVAVRDGLAGLEPLVGIPGSVGGALRGNAGAHGADVGQWVDSATVMTNTGETITRGRDELRFTHRASNLDELVILDATFKLEPGDPVALTQRMQKLWIVRRSQQPTGDQGAGRAFKDPSGATASSLIEQAGIKGIRVGGAEIFDRDPNFIIAGPKATADDVTQLLELIQSQVHERVGVELERELEIW
ncbi:MAG: UDP-N-acetylmuramate dehydrogenase [Pirellulaceae bacterium]|jgi:UDP-N-acetylmuramate dehydrogenase|nr:UDP-N-acetylmuramate dehydrogenase [Pirellulaceae bacterium]MDP7018111.1 UDP-N-acetylmuramate dehydrogenase [Pirellulaceae bacterium]